ncbi:hypothetical protein L249_7359 [Ophiocordyceps polyrhachis-furcata BCC 54312]|uniref:F-box domain-containing protein n=1 Tax=Ophiocordyceps polyrhachis-furcata BCC 54312 TaxID=1330021 RepID=A0A367LAY8_9HYPO|nr:hypothetical protein L249_7359 [Ophiocordyceps polyrhachis-furcata BCC 54312]
MAQQRLAMDPPHITEFASERYFEKLHQLSASQQSHQQSDPCTAATAPTLFLPFRETKLPDADAIKPPEPKRDKGRFFSLLPKVSRPPLKQPPVRGSEPDPAIQRVLVRLSIVSSPPGRPSDANHDALSLSLGQVFFSLPNELQVHIVSFLPLTDVLNLRLVCKSWHAIITLNESPIVRHHLDHYIPAYALRLYPAAVPGEITLHHLCSLWHRLHVAAKLAFLMCEWITKDIFLRQSEAQRASFAPQHERMRRRLIPLLFTIFHFFETYRTLHLKQIAELDGHGLQRKPYTINPIERQILAMYDDKTLLRVHEVFPLVISSFCRRLRPPTYVGRVERSLRGYLRERPSDEVHAAILCIGGLRQVERLWEIKGYNSRRAAVDAWYHALTKDQAVDACTSKLRLGLKGFGRKRPAAGPRPSSGDGWPRAKTTSDFPGPYSVDEPNWIFCTSLAAGMPMSIPPKEYAQLILGDLPSLQHIWLVTAEATILDRGIVPRTQDIKRNQQVMLDLIREDGLGEEDEWWYGRNILDSIRPPAGTADDDADC